WVRPGAERSALLPSVFPIRAYRREARVRRRRRSVAGAAAAAILSPIGRLFSVPADFSGSPGGAPHGRFPATVRSISCLFSATYTDTRTSEPAGGVLAQAEASDIGTSNRSPARSHTGGRRFG